MEQIKKLEKWWWDGPKHAIQCIRKIFFLMEKNQFHHFLFSWSRPMWSISCREPHIWILNSTSFSLQSRLSLTMPGYRRGSSCTTSVRNSVNFTLCCLPKIPAPPSPKKKKTGPRFSDLAAEVSFQPWYCCICVVPVGRGARKASLSCWLKVDHFKRAPTRPNLWHCKICETIRKGN